MIEEVVAALTEFLEDKPPNFPAVIPGLATVPRHPHSAQWQMPVAPKLLELHCDIDDGVRRFELDASPSSNLGLGFRFLAYSCRDCGESTKTYALLTVLKSVNTEGRDSKVAEVMKLGEFPPFAAPISARIQKLLDKEDLELYRKGTRSAAQGLGIAAATYFRRIVEHRWRLLVQELHRAAKKLGHGDLEVFDNALRQTQFSTAVKMLKGVIPDKLLILNGDNPLTLLYTPLSIQLHELTDAECLQQAADIRTVLTALLENIAEVLKDQEELKNAATRLKKTTRGT